MQKKDNTLIIVLTLIVLGVLAYVIWGRPDTKVTPPVDTTAGQTTAGTTTRPVIEGNSADLASLSINAGDTISNGDTITGSVRGAYFFEANMIGMFLDANKTSVKTFPINATSDWMTIDPVSFSFVANTAGVPKGTGYLRLHNDNPSGLPENDKFIDIPVLFD